MARRRSESRPDEPLLRFAPFGEIKIYWLYEHELDALGAGSSTSLFLNFALFLLPISITLIVTMLTTTIASDRLFAGFVSVSVITAIAGILLLLLWWRSHKQSGDLLAMIKARMSAEGTSATAESDRDANSPHGSEGHPPTTS